jgi:hypothetical protein
MFTPEQVLDFALENHIALKKGITRGDLSIQEVPISKHWANCGLVKCFSVTVPDDPAHIHDGGCDFRRFYETSNGRLADDGFISQMLNDVSANEPADSLHSSLMKSFGLLNNSASRNVK